MSKKPVAGGLILIFLISSFIPMVSSYESEENSEWYKTFGGGETDIAECLIQTSDGGHLITGATWSYGAGFFDVWLIKTDEYGNELWNKTYGGMEEDGGHCVVETLDGSYIITGYTRSFGNGLEDVWLIKTDEYGNELWNKTYGGKNVEWGKCVMEVHDGYIIVGTTYSYGTGEKDVWLIKTDEYGNEIWNKTFGGESAEYGNSIIKSDDGGYVIVGNTISYGAGFFDIYLLKTDEYGNEIWNKTFGGSDADRGEDVIQTKDGGYIIAGEATLHGAAWDDAILIKTDENGNMKWNKSYGGKNQDSGRSVIPTDDGGFLIGGTTASYGAGVFDARLIKTDEYGNEIWNKTFGGREGEESADRVVQLDDGSYVFTGYTYSYGAGKGDIWLVKCQDYIPPKINIVRPMERFLYLMDREVIPIGATVILGKITIKLEVDDPEERMDKVEFFLYGPNIDGREPRAVIYEPPYEWTLDDPAIGSRAISAITYYSNNTANVADLIYFWMFNI